jgi:hypothetical protein
LNGIEMPGCEPNVGPVRQKVRKKCPSGKGRLAGGGLRMLNAGLELELAIAQDQCLIPRSRCWGG